MKLVHRLVVGGGILPLALVAWGACAPELGVTDAQCPPFEDFKKVSPLLEQRCGTLDCHGAVSRPLRIYSSVGLRLPDDDPSDDIADGHYSGGPERTTLQEVEANYLTVCGLEPEIMTAVAAGAAEPTELTLVRKPRLSEKHKGGRIWDEGKPGDRCLVAWLRLAPAAGEGGGATGGVPFNDADCREALGAETPD